MSSHCSAKIASKAVHTCAVLSDRSARCWGYSSFGQLGDGLSSHNLQINTCRTFVDRRILDISWGALTCAVHNDYLLFAGAKPVTRAIGTSTHPPSASSIAVGDYHFKGLSMELLNVGVKMRVETR